MAKIGIENIKKIKLDVNLEERTFDSETTHLNVREMYSGKRYDKQPKNKDERNAMNEEIRKQNESIENEEGKIPLIKGFNGLMSSFTVIQTKPTSQGNIVHASISPTRYLIGQAMREVMKAGDYSAEDAQKMSPDMANVSLVVPVKIRNEYYILSQIKGAALGSGQVHSGLVAGNVDAKFLTKDNPLVAALRKETIEEMGINLNDLDYSSFVYMVDERETGQVNFAAIAKNTDHQFVLDRYEADTKKRLTLGEKLEVNGLADLPIAGIALVPLENRELGLRDVTCYKPTADGLIKVVENREVRPYTQATVDYLTKKENVKFLLEKAGF